MTTLEIKGDLSYFFDFSMPPNMNEMRDKEADTIAAISTPAGIGAISVVRMSGEGAKEILKKVWMGEQNPTDKFVTHRLYYGKLCKLSTDWAPERRECIDKVMAVWMGSPNSYTGEDMVEVSCHGGPIVTKLVLEELLKAGARLALPGEFTRRAFMNGKIDLAEAEAVSDVIHARSEKGLKLASEQLEGRLSNTVNKMMEELKDLRVFVEATVDFPEEDIEFIEHGGIKERLLKVREALAQLIDSYEEGRVYREGLRVVIMGSPNVGKSSILNMVIGHDRAIVHHTPGTTRDTIEETVILDGAPIFLIDTAGLGETKDEVEALGMGRAEARADVSDLILFVVDASHTLSDDEKNLVQKLKDKKIIVILNKTDLPLRLDIDDVAFLAGHGPLIYTSALKKEGILGLKKEILGVLRKLPHGESEGVHITSLRHKRALEDCLTHLEDAVSAVDGKASAEFIAAHMAPAMESLGSIVGRVTTEEVLNDIFNKFCIGK